MIIPESTRNQATQTNADYSIKYKYRKYKQRKKDMHQQKMIAKENRIETQNISEFYDTINKILNLFFVALTFIN